jgi:hypothetical protein
MTDEERANQARFSVTFPKELNDELQQQADLHGRSRNAELVHMLENSKVRMTGEADIKKDAAAAISMQIKRLIRNLTFSEGDLLWSDPNAGDELLDAMTTLVRAYIGEGGVPSPKLDETPGQRRGRSMLNQYLGVKCHGIDDDTHPDERRMLAELDLLPHVLWTKLEPKK